MATPPLNSIDLSSLPAFTPPLESIDLTAVSGAENSALLTLVAQGVGVRKTQGAGSASLEIIAIGSGLADTYRGTGHAELGLAASGSGYEDWLSKIPPIQFREVYRLIITGDKAGLSDLAIGRISSWQATSQAGDRASYLQAVIPAADDYVADISDRQSGDLVIEKGFQFSDGSERYEEIIRSRFDMLRPDRGGRALTLTLSGYMSGKKQQSGHRTATGVRSISAQNGKLRVRCDVDMFLQPGMSVTAINEIFIAGYINYYVNQFDKFCEIGER